MPMSRKSKDVRARALVGKSVGWIQRSRALAWGVVEEYEESRGPKTSPYRGKVLVCWLLLAAGVEATVPIWADPDQLEEMSQQTWRARRVAEGLADR